MNVILENQSWKSIPPMALVLVPTGSIEQHGPHLPLNTDTIIAETVAKGVAERYQKNFPSNAVFVAPPVQYGASGEHQEFPGTISIGHQVLQEMLIEMVRSISTWANHIVFINGHGGNQHSLVKAVTQMIYEGHKVSWVPCSTPGGDAHAGATETSLMLAIAPERVQLSQIESGNLANLQSLMAEITENGIRAVSPTGILGDPTLATSSLGKELIETMVSDVFERIIAGVLNASGCLQRSTDELDSQ